VTTPTIDRRAFLKTLAVAGAWPASMAGVMGTRSPLYLAYTSFAVRLARGREGAKSSNAGLDAEAFLDLCARFGVAGAQVDFSQLPLDDPGALDRVRAAFARKGVVLELSIPSKYLESPDAYARAAEIARALGATRARVALLSGRRYETFESHAAWDVFATKWRDVLPRMRPEFDRHPLKLAIENHKDWLASDLVALLESIDSPNVGACVDFGNNIALLEDPDDTIERLIPHAVTTHVKDMAVRRTDVGFELSEVPLGQGMLPLDRYVAALRRARPDVPLCLEMLTRDPLVVPYKTDRFWTTFDAAARSDDRVRRFETRVLSQAWERPLPRISGLEPAAQLRAEDENVLRSLAYATKALKIA
jgi:sugar phosphate isomerase/epimerase